MKTPWSDAGLDGWRGCTLGAGLFTLPVPPDWQHRPAGLMDGAFVLPDGRTVEYGVGSFEDPQAIRSGELGRYIADLVPTLADEPAARILDNIAVGIRPAEGDRPARVTVVSVALFGTTHLRRAWLRTTLRPGDESDDARACAAMLARAMGRGGFAAAATPHDRIAPSPAMKLITPWNCIFLRVPEHWRYMRHPGGRYACDVLPEQMPPDPTLWIDFDLLEIGADPARSGSTGFDDRRQRAGRDMADTLRGRLPAALHPEPDDRWMEMESSAEEDGEELSIFDLRHVRMAPPTAMITHFNLVLPTREVGTPAVQALLRLMYDEIRKAVILLPDPAWG